MTIISLRIGNSEVIPGSDVASYTLNRLSTIRLNDGTIIQTTQPVTVRLKDGFVPVSWGINQDERKSLGGGK